MRRVWCLYEFDNTIRLKGPDKLVLLAPGICLLDMAKVGGRVGGGVGGSRGRGGGGSRGWGGGGKGLGAAGAAV